MRRCGVRLAGWKSLGLKVKKNVKRIYLLFFFPLQRENAPERGKKERKKEWKKERVEYKSKRRTSIDQEIREKTRLLKYSKSNYYNKSY